MLCELTELYESGYVAVVVLNCLRSVASMHTSKTILTQDMIWARSNKGQMKGQIFKFSDNHVGSTWSQTHSGI